MKRIIFIIFIMVIIGYMMPASALCRAMSNDEIVQELKALKERIHKLEKELTEKDKEIEEMKAAASQRKEEAPGESGQLNWFDRLTFSGAIEVEYGHESREVKDPANNLRSVSTDNDDIVLATVELGIDAQINKYAQGHVLLLYEEDEDGDRVRLDEGTIRLGGTEETYGFYLLAGKYYPHFSELNSYLVSDPLTLEIFEMRETAAQVGFENDWVSTGLGVFHGDIESDFEDESRINGFFADANIHNPEDTLGGLSLLVGVSYLNNVADSDTLEGEVQDLNGDGLPNDLNDDVGGLAAYLVAEYGQFSFGAEYIKALDDFLAGEMGYAVDRNGINRRTEPAAWNLEFAFRPLESLQLAVRYEGTDEMFGLFPEDQWGGAVSWEIFKYTTLSAEYLHGEYDENNQNGDGMIEDERDLFTLQLAIEF
ncbi:MAG: LbtU family siderophore porin [Thermodesulfobacteriota bacterium]|nr:LbtU family siderophore porin [Thermodesulfobacteriota bacterium]